jgi:hypothetical protein
MRPAKPLLLSLVLVAACAASTRSIPGTRIPASMENRKLVGVVEKYRLAVERQDAVALYAMASKSYWEDGGTPTASDDYGYDGLKDVLLGRFQRADDIRYSIKYLRVKMEGEKAWVDVMVDASYTVATSRGEERVDKRDKSQFVLERNGDRWLFVSGM